VNVRYFIWRYNDIFEVVRHDAQSFIVVQTNIRTREKAEEATRIWQQREQEKNSGG